MTTQTQHTALPPVVDRDTWIAERTALLAREKAHSREGDAIAAARRRLPMTEVDARALVTGPDGPVPFLDVFDGRDQMLVYKHMWHAGMPIEDQCEGCTLSIWNVQDTSYLAARGVSFAVLCEGPWDEVAPFVDFMGYRLPWYSAHGVEDPAVGAGLVDDRGLISAYLRDGDRVYLTGEVVARGVETIMPSLKLLDMTAFGRKESWEDSPQGWPREPMGWWRQDGRPVAQWTRPGATPVGDSAPCTH